MTKTLIDTQKSINDFLTEANTCALQKLGFAAMLIVFPVILSVSEALERAKAPSSAGQSYPDKDLFKEFVPRMADNSWLVLRDPNSSLSNQDIAIDLSNVRDDLAHQLSLPKHIGMINIKSEAKEYFKDHPGIARVISVLEFVQEVSRTVDSVIKMYPTVPFDPNPKGNPRSPAEQVFLSSTMSSASSPRQAG
ncbi:MAG: hypothetical protein BroJett011_29600 [Chloroflexota bacterium]|nr:MAG: hypothetical protein BroJett011_29600 [Chloroflexota bacterium]